MSLVYHGYPCPLPSHPLGVLILCGYLLSPALFLAGPTQIVPSSAVHTGSMAWPSWLSGLYYHILGAGLRDYVFLLPHVAGLKRRVLLPEIFAEAPAEAPAGALR